MLFLLLYSLSLLPGSQTSPDCQFSCVDYPCLKSSWICDGHFQCEDDWDEGREPG